jgi:hypothetical protein
MFRTHASGPRAPWLMLMAAICLSASACTYGPPQHRVWIQQAEGRPETRTFAAIVWSEVRREATGLAAFPDGGVPKLSEQAVTIYVADLDRRATRRVGQIRIPREMELSHEPFLPGWRGSSFFVQISGCLNPHAECNDRNLNRAAYRIDEDGTIARVDSVPRPLEREPGMGARAPGERVYMRVSATRDTVRVRTEDEGPFVARFVLNGDGELVPIP